MSDELKRTPLYPLYESLPGVRLVDFGGWELPVQFAGIQREHEAVRTRAGLFDVSHMGEFMVSGPFAEAFLQRITTNDVSKLADGQAQYTLMCDASGGVVDDLLVYRLTAGMYMTVVNASNIAKDYDWMREHLLDDTVVADVSGETALLALQGPSVAAILDAAAGTALAGRLAPFHFLADVPLGGASCLVSRTGYTGEDGFELYAPAAQAPALWRLLLEAGAPFGLEPAGLGARDTLRFEARLPLYGQELSAGITPLEAGLGYFVKLDKGDFIGRDALLAQKSAGVPRKLVGIETLDRGIPRHGYAVYDGDRQIGKVTSGTQSPTLKRSLGLALVEADYAKPDTAFDLDIRGKRVRAKVVPTPFYKRRPPDRT
ncbi:glycine cleavage system aminomethyltransferase GcvT [Cohnella sp. JJ-181]|uniref:glycine cleavage system aminomethyltransferase GcvT n=1 Tax=Cohnella rhizoplanae TaxID=2974897 RepID=UPI0022FF9130|nr:glycine cleavage system aminomethyltransferase GcvT [Cohnella sp. JJ-181]CAI6075783.1 Aminomethyltransferase [Cohnella sp. JJ-181]